jgi:predicted dehydrogenase
MMKIGILGAARIAPVAVIEPAARRDDVTVYAVASRRPGAAADYAKEHGIEVVHDSYDDLIADPDIDLIYNALPPVDHARWSISALDAGKHVLCEKPFAMNAREAEVMTDAAKRTGKRLIEAFHDRLHPVFEYLLDLKASGRLGEIEKLEGVFEVHIPFRPNELRHLPDQGGGALMDLGCYPVHWVRSLMGTEPEVVSAEGEKSKTGVDLRMYAELAFPGGAVANIRTDMREGTALKAFLAVDCEHGRIEIENPIHPHNGHSIREWLGGGYRVHTVAGNTTYDHQLASVIEAIKTGTPHPCEGADSVNNMAVIGAIYKKAGFDPR